MARKSDFQIRLEYSVARTLFGFLSILPCGGALFVCRIVSSLGYHLLGSLRRVGIRSLGIAFPEKTVAERTDIKRNIPKPRPRPCRDEPVHEDDAGGC